MGSHPPNPSLIDTCVHCGFCLPTCPTYVLWGEEMDSPRGRIYLMKAGLEGRTEMTPAFVNHFDACLGCMACVTSCPSGVQYAPLIEATRAQIERRHPRSLADRLFRGAIFALFPFPNRLRVALVPLAIFQQTIGKHRGDREGREATDLSQQSSRSRRFLPRVTTSLFARVRAMLSLAPPVTLGSLFSSLPARTPAAGADG